MDETGGTAFYDTLARRFGGYQTYVAHDVVFETEDPDAVFRKQVFGRASPDAAALDLGCADGQFTLLLTPYFGRVVGADLSVEMLAAAERGRAAQDARNVAFARLDATHLPYEDGEFDVVFSRRGPLAQAEAFRVLRPGGRYLELQVGEADARDLKGVFGRGQGYTTRDEPAMLRRRAAIELAGFAVELASEYKYIEHYPSPEALASLLSRVPIFVDFDPAVDTGRLARYVEAHRGAAGIRLERHQFLIVARRPSDAPPLQPE